MLARDPNAGFCIGLQRNNRPVEWSNLENKRKNRFLLRQCILKGEGRGSEMSDVAYGVRRIGDAFSSVYRLSESPNSQLNMFRFLLGF